LVEIAPLRFRRVPHENRVADSSVSLTEEQGLAVAELANGGSFLLHGVTGSGKTEVYLRAAAAALQEGRGVIVLVPEIALTPQTVGRFKARFGDMVAVLHSGLSDGEKFDEWSRLRAGEARVAVGPRSAIFAPVANLGLIVIDEEHDSSYKHEGDPRYDARRVAEKRAAIAGATLVVGSATPRPETWQRLPHLKLSTRVDDRPLPPVQLLDMRGLKHPLHPETVRALADTRKAIVLLNRRGWSNFLTCRDCGKVWECPHCDVSLVLHRRLSSLNCHHCGHYERIPEQCSDCGSLAVARYGAGTERMEEELGALIDLPIFRMDADTTSRKNSVPELLERFRVAESGVLLGTQMVAKGHDFKDVTLAVVLDADSTLRFPDFRAEERTFALIAQLAGRAGRGPQGGRVLVQTLFPGAPAIAAASRHDATGFVTGELARREALSYPPFSDLVRIVCGAEESQIAKHAAETIATGLREEIGGTREGELQPAAQQPSEPAAEVLGPASLFRLRGRYRFQIVLKIRDRAKTLSSVNSAVSKASQSRANRSVTFSVDVDPQ
jgi:primosomal protein N' (replication factor Y)